MARRNQEFQTIRSEGGLLPADLLRRVIDRSTNLAGTRPEDYGLPAGERLNEVITQSWNRLLKHWAEFCAAKENLPENEAGTGLTNDKWNLPLLRELGFGLLPTSAGPEIGGRTYAISRFFGPVPIHLIGCGLSLDRRTRGQRGAAAVNPHGLVQEFLNRSDDHLWAIVSNGLRLRILRDNQALSRQAFLEFDLEAMFNGEVYSDFVLLWLVAHATRFAPREGDRPETCWLEQWTQEAEEQGTRALGELRIGVERALAILGEGFTSHPRNTALRDALRSGQLSPTDLHAQLLRLVYRLIFLFVAEDRTVEGHALLHPLEDSDAAQKARERYAAYYSTARLREMAGRIKGSRHGDLWQQFQLLVKALSGDPDGATIREQLALPAFGSFLWDPASTAALNDAELTNYDLLEALRHLAFTRQGKVLRPVDYKNLGAEELGGVYESLLALTPQVSSDGARFYFAEFAGNERKTSGSYYTPDSLVQCLLDSALDPVVEEAIRDKLPAEAEQAILNLKVCDPAVGSGHFLVGAAHRLARHLARVRALAEGESEPSPLLYQHALRDVIGRCLYGVDVNPMAAELCRVSLWLEALEPGKPLSFLDHHIRVGNSLLGTTPELIAAGLPDDAFKPIEGDDKKFCAALKKRNKKEREGGQMALGLSEVAEPQAEYNTLADRAKGLDQAPDDSLEAWQRKAEQFQRLVVSPEYRHQQQIADAWCAAFVWPKHADAPEPITTDTIRRLEEDVNALSPAQCDELERLANQYQFFHWHLAFPEVFARGGFDCMLGNPPWEAEELVEKEFFAGVAPEIATVRTKAKRAKLINELKDTNPSLFKAWKDEVRHFHARINFVRSSGCYPLGSSGKLNTYRLFAELSARLVSISGRLAQILKSGIVSAQEGQRLFRRWVEDGRVVEIREFINTKRLFPDVVANERFCWLVLLGEGSRSKLSTYAFALETIEEAFDSPRIFSVSTEDLATLNPADKSIPPLTSERDYRLLLKLHRSAQPLRVNENNFDPWGIHYTQGHLNSASSSSLFANNTYEQLHEHGAVLDHKGWFRNGNEYYVPLYEGKFIAQLNHRFATFDGVPEKRRFGVKAEAIRVNVQQLQDAEYEILPRYWLKRSDAEEVFSAKGTQLDWLFGFRDVCRAVVDARTVQACVLPRLPCLDGVPLLVFDVRQTAVETALYFNALWASFPFDYCARQKIHGAHLTKAIAYQLPIPSKASLANNWFGVNYWDFIRSRALELTVVSSSLLGFAKDLGYDGPPFRWDEERRFLIRCELDAAFFHLYLPANEQGNWRPARKDDGCPYDETPEQLEELKRYFPTPRDAVDYIMDTFPIVRRKDDEQYGEYRTKRVILEIYDAMQEAIRTGQPYQTLLDPPPGPPLDANGNFVSYAEISDNPPPHIHLPRDAEQPVEADYGSLADGAWMRPMADQRAETGVQLAAILKAMDGPLPARQVRLAALLALEPRLLLPYLDEEATTWRRLIGAEVDPLPQGASAFIARNDQAWGAAVRNLRANGHLIEDIQAGTWAPGDNLDQFPTSGWPDGRAGMVLDVLRRHATDAVVTALPPELRDWLDAAAA